MTATVINNANWAIIWDRSAANHVCRRDVGIAFVDDRIAFVGQDHQGRATG